MRLLGWIVALIALAFATGHLLSACMSALSTATLAGGVR